MKRIVTTIAGSYLVAAIAWSAWVFFDDRDGGVNWQTAFSAAEVLVSIGSISGLVIALTELNQALKRPGPELRLSAKNLRGNGWEVMLWNIGGEPAQRVQVWVKDTVHRAPRGPRPTPLRITMNGDEWGAGAIDVDYDSAPTGWEASRQGVSLGFDLPRHRGHVVVLPDIAPQGLLEVTARAMNALDEAKWASTDGEVALPKEAL